MIAFCGVTELDKFTKAIAEGAEVFAGTETKASFMQSNRWEPWFPLPPDGPRGK